MAYHSRKPPVALPWWQDRLLRDLGALLAVLLLLQAVTMGWQHYATSRREARAAAVLEPLNPWRRRVGLAPVTAALAERSFDGDSLVHLYLPLPARLRRYGPCVTDKHILYAAPTRRVRWEAETIWLCPDRCQARGQPLVELTTTYSARAAGRPKIRFELMGEGGTRRLTRAEADSVLAYWKAQGARDSLAALASRR